jgi:hypothetical protein
MEKPTGVIQKIIESLQQVNALDIYSSIEKDIILHNLRAAYMIFLNIPVAEQNTENRVEKLFVADKCDEMMRQLDDEMIDVEAIEEEAIEEETVEEEIVEEEIVEEELLVTEELLVEESLPSVLTDGTEMEEMENEEMENEEEENEEEEQEEIVEEDPLETEEPLVPKAPLVEEKPVMDDILEFIPDAKPYPTLLFDEMIIPKSEKKSLNDLLIEKKEDHSLGARFQQSSIPDLTKAIAINEKFTFIRELFHNSGVDFSNAIQKLNECENIDAAFFLMEDLKHQYIWDTTSSSYLSLCDLVRRRFL